MKLKKFNNYIFKLALFIFLIVSSYFNAYSEKLPIPRFASIKSAEVNARTGPSNRYPIEWTFIKKGEPVEIFAEFEQWRRIRDKYGEGGWVHSSMLLGKRFVVVKGDEPHPLYKRPNTSSDIVARVSPDVRCELLKCQDKLCNIKCRNYKGWINQLVLWGVYPEEKW